MDQEKAMQWMRWLGEDIYIKLLLEIMEERLREIDSITIYLAGSQAES